MKTPVERKRRTSSEPKESAPKPLQYVLRLYVAGINPKSLAAIRSITRICVERLKGRYKLEVIDVYQRPSLAAGDQIVAIPTLIKKLPLPLRRIIGDLSDQEKVLVGLDLRPKE